VMRERAVGLMEMFAQHRSEKLDHSR